jgi:quercetin dioxygenase-like cupin family protein
VEQGILTVTVDETVMAVTQGSSAVARTDAPHAYANDSDEEVWFTMTVSERHS